MTDIDRAESGTELHSESAYAAWLQLMAVLYDPFVWLGEQPSLWLYLLVTLLGTILIQRYILQSIVTDPLRRIGAALLLTGSSYAVVFSFDRANVELAMALLVGAALLLCRRLHFGSGTCWRYSRRAAP